MTSVNVARARKAMSSNRHIQGRSKRTFFTHPSVSITLLNRVHFQLTDEHFMFDCQMPNGVST